MHEPDKNAVEPHSHLSVGFILLPHFTLLPFAAFVDTLRLAADEGDKSRPINCQWTVMAPDMKAIQSSCNVSITPWEKLRSPEDFDYIVVVGGLLHQGPVMNKAVLEYLQQAAAAHTTLVGLCTGSIALARAGLMNGRRCCVSWFHYQDLVNLDVNVKPVADQLYVDEGDRITCAGGTAAADLAAAIIERHLGRNWARKSLRILVMDKARAANAPQPQPSQGIVTENKWVRKALLLMEQNLNRPLTTDQLADRLNLSKRQLERLCHAETGESLQKLYRVIRLRYGLWLLNHSERSITDIADECGFSDTAHFSRAFRQFFTQTPKQVRQSGTFNPDFD